MIAIMSSLLDLLSANPAPEVFLRTGAILFARGDEVRHLYVVRSGSIHLVRYQEDGAPTVMQRACAGNLVAEASLFAERYHCDGLAVADAITTRFSVAEIRQRMALEPLFSRACAEHMAREVHRMRIRSEILATRTVSARLGAWLAFNPLPAKGEWSAVADDIGVTREALYRELAKRRQSLARKQSSRITFDR